MGVIYKNGIPYGGGSYVDVQNNGDIYVDGVCIRKVLTQAEYDAITIPDPRTEYIIVESSSSSVS